MTKPSDPMPSSAENVELDPAELLGFEHLERDLAAPKLDFPVSTEDAVGLAFNKRGEVPPGPLSDRRVKTNIRRSGVTADGLELFRFQYLGEDREFEGVMAQDLLADERRRGAVQVGADGFFRVDYAQLGLASLVTAEMRAAGERAAARARA